jgi:hypothetical protein
VREERRRRRKEVQWMMDDGFLNNQFLINMILVGVYIQV